MKTNNTTRRNATAELINRDEIEELMKSLDNTQKGIDVLCRERCDIQCKLNKLLREKFNREIELNKYAWKPSLSGEDFLIENKEESVNKLLKVYVDSYNTIEIEKDIILCVVPNSVTIYPKYINDSCDGMELLLKFISKRGIKLSHSESVEQELWEKEKYLKNITALIRLIKKSQV